MIICQRCGTKNEDGSNYCCECGKQLTPEKAAVVMPSCKCPSCGSLEPAGNVFCGKCGARLTQAEPVYPQCGEKESCEACCFFVRPSDYGFQCMHDWCRVISFMNYEVCKYFKPKRGVTL